MMFIRVILIALCLSSLLGCSQATLLSSIGIASGVAQKSTASVVYSGVDLGVSATTDKSIREHIFEEEGEPVAPLIPPNSNIKWVTPK